MTVPGPVEPVIQRLQAAVDSPGSVCVSRLLGQHLDITIDHDQRHRWSPCVQMELEQRGDETLIHGLIGPHPNVWTMFAFINITAISVIIFGLMFGCSQVLLGMSPWGLWTVAAGVGLLGVMYVLSQVGRRLAAEQSTLLMDLIRTAIGDDAA